MSPPFAQLGESSGYCKYCLVNRVEGPSPANRVILAQYNYGLGRARILVKYLPICSDCVGQGRGPRR